MLSNKLSNYVMMCETKSYGVYKKMQKVIYDVDRCIFPLFDDLAIDQMKEKAKDVLEFSNKPVYNAILNDIDAMKKKYDKYYIGSISRRI